jgi:hypothetical protein
MISIFGRFPGEKYRGLSKEGPAIDLMFRDHTQNPGGKPLFASII